MSHSTPTNTAITPRERVRTALRHEEPDRTPVDFLATTEVWAKLVAELPDEPPPSALDEFMDPQREAVLRALQVDCRVLSYDMFCRPPEGVLHPGAAVDWWGSLNRSTPNRMWRQRNADGTWNDIWGTHSERVETTFGAYEGFVDWPLSQAESVEDLKRHAWPEPDWWDFSPLPDLLKVMDQGGETHVRFRIGSVFEIAWQLRGMQEFLLDLGSQPELPLYIMDRLTDIYVENTRRVLELAGDRLDMVYFYDDVATQASLMISKHMWRDYVRPRHARLVEVAHRYGKPVMYHCDGSVWPLIPEFIDLGVDVLNPIQPDAKGMDLAQIKAAYGDRLCFHGGVDINQTLPRGTPDEVRAEVRERVRVLGAGGGYILCSSHHLQPDTPTENVRAMYEVGLRYRA
jgi:uroporphyrinogen decarboxylase